MPKIIDAGPPTVDDRCGTPAGYKAHRRRGESTCQPCRDAINAYQKERTDPVARSDYMRTYYAEHREEIIESARRWYANNREHAAATLRRYREENRDKHRSDNRRWRANNLEKARKSANEWRKRNPEKGREVERRRRAAKVGDPYTEDDVLFSYGTVCHLCGEEIDMAAPRRIGRAGWQMGLHVDHVVPIALGGPDCLENVRPAHGLCNVAKGTAIG